jgi:hypothetical protein
MLTGATLVTIRRERYHYFVQRGVLHWLELAARPREISSVGAVVDWPPVVTSRATLTILTWSLPTWQLTWSRPHWSVYVAMVWTGTFSNCHLIQNLEYCWNFAKISKIHVNSKNANKISKFSQK